ncbi:hypothetical protein ACHAW6_009675 [Cyclotella cf. meneghiniana]
MISSFPSVICFVSSPVSCICSAPMSSLSSCSTLICSTCSSILSCICSKCSFSPSSGCPTCPASPSCSCPKCPASPSCSCPTCPASPSCSCSTCPSSPSCSCSTCKTSPCSCPTSMSSPSCRCSACISSPSCRRIQRRMPISSNSPRFSRRLHVDRTNVKHGMGNLQNHWGDDLIVERCGVDLNAHPALHDGKSIRSNGSHSPNRNIGPNRLKSSSCGHGKSGNDISRIKPLTLQLFLDLILRNPRLRHGLSQLLLRLFLYHFGGLGSVLLTRNARPCPLLSYCLNIVGSSNTQSFLPRTIQPPRHVSSSFPLQESSRRIQRINMPYNFFRYGTFFRGTVSMAVGSIRTGGDQCSEAFVAWMSGYVDAATTQDVVVSGKYGCGGAVVIAAAHSWRCLCTIVGCWGEETGERNL